MAKAIGQFTIYDFHDVYSSPTAPTKPIKDMLWLDTSVKPPLMRVWNGTGWEVANDFDVGIRNKVRNSAFLKGKESWNLSTNVTIDTNRTLEGNPSCKSSQSGLAEDAWRGCVNYSIPDENTTLIKGVTYTVSCYYFVEDRSIIDRGIALECKGRKVGSTSSSENGIISITVDGDKIVEGKWTKITGTFTPSYDFERSCVRAYVRRNGIAWFTNFTLVNGNKSGDWTVAPEDINSSIESIKEITESNSTAINVMQGQIETAINNTKIVKDGQTILLKDDYNRTVAKVDSLNSTIGTHTTKINELTGNITSVDSKVNSVQRDLEGTKSTVSSHSTSITDLSSKVSTQGSSIAQLKTQIALKVEQSDINSAISTVDKKITTINNQVTAIETNLSSITQRVSSTESTLNTHTTQINAVDEKINSKVAEIKATTDTITSKVEIIESNTTTINGNITNLQSKVNTVESKITGTAIVNTISSTITGGTGSISTTQFIMDKNGLTIKNGALKIQNKSGTTVFNSDTNGNLIITGTLKSQKGDMFVALDSGGVTFQDWNRKEQMLRIAMTSFSSNRDYNGVTFAMPQYSDFIRYSYIKKADLTEGWSSSDTQYSFLDFWSDDRTIEGKTFKKGINIHAPMYVGTNGILLDSGNAHTSDLKGNLTWNTINGLMGVMGDNGCFLGYKNGEAYNARLVITEGAHPGTGDNIRSYGNWNASAYTIHNAHFNGLSLTIKGSKNCIQETKNYGERLINAYETAEYFYGDLGFGKINEDGECLIYIDDIFSECVNTDIEYHVFTQAYTGLIKTIERCKTYFIVRGDAGTEFSWEFKAKRPGYEENRLDIMSEENQGENETELEDLLLMEEIA